MPFICSTLLLIFKDFFYWYPRELSAKKGLWLGTLMAFLLFASSMISFLSGAGEYYVIRIHGTCAHTYFGQIRAWSRKTHLLMFIDTIMQSNFVFCLLTLSAAALSSPSFRLRDSLLIHSQDTTEINNYFYYFQNKFVTIF